MCGIFGWITPASRGLDRQKLVELTGLLRHRGPDAAGYAMETIAGDAWQLAFGHRRLAIIDLSPSGTQPMADADQRLLIFNGEIYNYLELREELERLRVSFSTTSDTEVLLQALRVWGRNALPRLRGMFAFAYWDPAERELILARDPFGKKPLYMAELPGGGLVFGSELHALAAFPGLDRSFDWDSLSEYMLQRYVSAPHTFFRWIKKLAPGHVAVWRDGALRTSRYYTPPFANARPEPMDMSEAVRRFTTSLREAVRLRLRSDAPFGAFLSGGIDSATIVGLMAEESSRPVATFSVGFRESEFSELAYARLVAERFKTDHSELIVTPDAIFDTLPEAALHRGAPVSEPADIPILLLSRQASQSVKMVLTGEGSDELLAGYPKHKVEPWVSLYQGLMPASFHQRVAGPLMDWLPYGARRAAVALRAFSEPDPATRMQLWFGATSPADAAALLARPGGRAADPFPVSGQGSPLKRTLFFDQTSWLPDNLLERGDRMMMAASIEGRMPFMDVGLAETVASFPDSILLGAQGGKAVLRTSVRHLLPPEIVSRRKVGFRVPVHVWFRTTLRDMLYEHLLSADSNIRVMCRPQRVAEVLDEHTTGRRNHEKLLWSLLNLEVFTRVLKPSLSS